ncbi:hypothetical protein FI667_g10202, partial [Globisporangium splendens]
MAEKAVRQSSSLLQQELNQLLQADAHCHERYLACLRGCAAVYDKRKAHFERINTKRPHDDDNSQPAMQQHRIFSISANDDPWNVFTFHYASTNSRLAIKRLAFEWSDLHVTSLHTACANGDLELVRRLLQYAGHQLKWRSCTLTHDSSGPTRLVSRYQQDARQEKVLASLQLFFCPRDLTNVVTVAGDLPDRLPQWLDACITLAFHEAALVVFGAYVTTGGTISIDRVLVQYGVMIASRHHNLHHLLDAGQAPQEFLVTSLERWLEMEEEQQQVDAVDLASVDTVLRCCAYNAPFELIEQIVDLVARMHHDDDKQSLLAALMAGTGARVHGKTLVEWLVHHARKDVIALLLVNKEKTTSAPHHHWTSLCLPVETDSKRAFLMWLLELRSSFSALPVDDGTDVLKEEEELLQWLVLKRAVWWDSPLVFSCIIVSLYEKLLQRFTIATEDKEHPQPDINESSNAPTLLLLKWLQFVIPHWLRHSAAQYVASPPVSAQARNSPLTLQTAFTRWRRTQIDKADESVQAAGVAFPAILTLQQRKRLCIVLRHWCFANAFVALQRWKHATDTSMQLRHHRVESVLDDVVAHMRQNRFTSPRVLQMQLQKSIVHMQWEEEALKLHWR